MEKPWKKHGENSMDSLENHGAWSQSKIPWFSWGNFHASMEQENCKNIPHKSMESKTMESMENMGIYKNESMESMESMVISSILLLIISRKHGKHGKKAWKAWKSMGVMQMNLHLSGSLVAAGFPGLY